MPDEFFEISFYPLAIGFGSIGAALNWDQVSVLFVDHIFRAINHTWPVLDFDTWIGRNPPPPPDCWSNSPCVTISYWHAIAK